MTRIYRKNKGGVIVNVLLELNTLYSDYLKDNSSDNEGKLEYIKTFFEERPEIYNTVYDIINGKTEIEDKTKLTKIFELFNYVILNYETLDFRFNLQTYEYKTIKFRHIFNLFIDKFIKSNDKDIYRILDNFIRNLNSKYNINILPPILPQERENYGSYDTRFAYNTHNGGKLNKTHLIYKSKDGRQIKKKIYMINGKPKVRDGKKNNKINYIALSTYKKKYP